MKTNLPGDFDKLAQAAIDDEATDGQLEALESAIMESHDGADVFLEMAEQQALSVSAAPDIAPNIAPVEGRKMPLLVKVLLVGSCAAAAAVVTLVGAGILYFQFATGTPSKAQVAATPVAVYPDGAEAVPPLATDAVPEPSTSILLLSGLTFFFLRRRR